MTNYLCAVPSDSGYPSPNIPYSANAAAVAQALLSIPVLTGVQVTFSQSGGMVCQPRANIVQIAFTDNFGPQPPLVAVPDSTMTSQGGTIIVATAGMALSDVTGKLLTSVTGKGWSGWVRRDIPDDSLLNDGFVWGRNARS
jgi:hypothetical protein